MCSSARKLSEPIAEISLYRVSSASSPSPPPGAARRLPPHCLEGPLEGWPCDPTPLSARGFRQPSALMCLCRELSTIYGPIGEGKSSSDYQLLRFLALWLELETDIWITSPEGSTCFLEQSRLTETSGPLHRPWEAPSELSELLCTPAPSTHPVPFNSVPLTAHLS